jgi:hypothetical protein
MSTRDQAEALIELFKSISVLGEWTKNRLDASTTLHFTKNQHLKNTREAPSLHSLHAGWGIEVLQPSCNPLTFGYLSYR